MEETTELNNDSSLSRADENPWYVLATIYGEVPVFEVENKNRNAWNAWALSDLNEVQKASVAKKIEILCTRRQAGIILDKK